MELSLLDYNKTQVTNLYHLKRAWVGLWPIKLV